ncbi:hypothetical protein DL769_004758 [Monosporascus sp. CRB-8-3]|nr:hypothetical protein DL769_004758 [Monosporascus sp. CRB-8-3]
MTAKSSTTKSQSSEASEETGDKIDVKKSFNKLRREFRESTYVSYSEFSNRTACSFDFGADGYSGSCNYGGELLQVTSRSKKYSVVFARGDFEYSLNSALARGQRSIGGKSAFGLKAAPPIHQRKPQGDATVNKDGHSVGLGPMIERGCFNYRWPFHEYIAQSIPVDKPSKNSKVEPAKTGGNKPTNDTHEVREAGTCAFFSFAKGRFIYQVFRIQSQCRPSIPYCHPLGLGSEFVLRIGGPTKFYTMVPQTGRGGNPSDSKHSGVKRTEAVRFSAKKYPDLSLVIKLFRLKRDGSDGYETVEVTHEDEAHDPTYSEVIKFPLEKNKNADSRTEVFVAAFCLQDESSDDFPDPPSSEEIFEYVGVDPTSENAMCTMWETIFLEQNEKFCSISEFSEVKLIARCLEKILHVDLIPESFGNEYETEGSDEKKKTVGPLASVGNIFLQADVDLESLLVHDFLAQYQDPNKDDRGVRSDGHQEIQSAASVPDISKIDPNTGLCELINDRIQRVVDYLIRTMIIPNKPDGKAVLMPAINIMGGSTRYYYVMITLCYRLPSDGYGLDGTTKEREALLQWCHHGSVLKLVEEGVLPKTFGGRHLERKVQILRTTSRIILAAKVSSKQPYLPEDEIVDRLAFLAEALELGGRVSRPGDRSEASIAYPSIKRIRERDFTRHINPGLLPPGETGDTGGPWELHALCHHSRLVVANLEKYDPEDPEKRERWVEEVNEFKSKSCEFLTSEASLVPCWERTNPAARCGWIRSEATAVLGSTLMDIWEKNIKYASKLKEQRGKHEDVSTNDENDAGHESNSPTYNADGSQPPISAMTTKKKGKYSQDICRPLGGPLTVNGLSEMQLDSLDRLTGLNNGPPPIDWTRFRPPRRYHPEDFFDSLEDTPDRYKQANIANSKFQVLY